MLRIIWWLMVASLCFQSQYLNAKDKKEILIVAHGGFNSCAKHKAFDEKNPYGMNLSKYTMMIVNSLKQSYPDHHFKWVLLCLGYVAPPKTKVKLILSERPKTLFSAKVKDVPNIILASLKQRDAPVFLIGHSYGSWVTMRAAQALKGKLNIKQVVSLDPISPIHCKPYTLPFYVKGCHESPRDIDGSKVAKSTKEWINYYQTDDFWLHSGKMDDAKNTSKEYDKYGHFKIAKDKNMWRKVVASIVSELPKL